MTPDAVDIEPLDVPREGIPDVTHEDIDDAVAALTAGHGPFSIDTERAMGIRYSARAYLVQIRREGAGTFLIDPVGIEDRWPRRSPPTSGSSTRRTRTCRLCARSA